MPRTTARRATHVHSQPPQSPPTLTFRSRSACLYFRVKKFRSAISSSIWRASRRRLMYLLTRVPGVVWTTFVEKDERFLSFSEAVLNALRCPSRKERKR